MVGHITTFSKWIVTEVGKYRIASQIDNSMVVLGHMFVGVVFVRVVMVEIVRLYYERENLVEHIMLML